VKSILVCDSALPAMPLKGLVFTLTAHAGLSSRRGLDAAGASVTDVVQNVNSLIQQRGKQHLDLISKLAWTEGAAESLQEAIDEVVKRLDLDVTTKIKSDHQETQTALDNAISALDGTTKSALQHKATADTNDGSWLDCIRQEKAAREDIEAAEAAVIAARDAKVAPCQAREDAREFTFEPTEVDKIVCDHSEDGHCDLQLQNFDNTLTDMVQSLKDARDAKEAIYVAANNACDAATAELASKESDLSAAGTAWQTKKAECQSKHTHRSTSACTFGAKLQSKCADVADYNTLIDAIDKENGGSYSEPDRIEEWSTVHVTVCLLNEVAASGNLNEETLNKCEASENYQKDIGDLDRKGAMFNDLTSAANFQCSETTITFKGQDWRITNDGASSTDYVLVENYARPVNLAEGQNPFDFCASPVGPGKR